MFSIKFYVLLITAVLTSQYSIAQSYFHTHKIKLPEDISFYDNQFSSLYISDGKLFLMSECRIEDNSPAFITYAPLKDIDLAIKDSDYTASFHRIILKNLDTISDILKSRNQVYEGLEAMSIAGNTYYFSIETNTPSDSCYIIKGNLKDSAIQLEKDHLLAIAKPKDENGKAIYNTGFESMEINKGKIHAFFEYNYFKKGNDVIQVDLSLNPKSCVRIPIKDVPFRITDVSWDKKNQCYWGINFFFQGDGGDTIYRVSQNDANYNLMYSNKKLRSYGRIIQIKTDKNQFYYQPFKDLPQEYWSYNWEGLAVYKNGFFISNDKYTKKRPYESVLLYLSQ